MRIQLTKQKTKTNVIKIWICLIVLITSCKTVEYVYPTYQLPETPVNYKYSASDIEKIRAQLSVENDNLLQTILVNYIFNLLAWEKWADTVKDIIKPPPEVK